VVTVVTDLKITGKIAQFGSGMIQEVSRKLLGQFVDCLESKLVAPADEPALTPAAGDVAEPVAASSAAAAPAPAPAPAPTPAPAPAPSPADSEPAALDILALSRGAVAKRAIPAAIGAAVVAAIVYLIVR
jgi:hypothetical protein